MANEFNEGEGAGTKNPAAPIGETQTHTQMQFEDEPQIHQEESEGEAESESPSTGATWVNDALEWLTTTVRERPLEALLVVAGASLVTGVLTGTLIKTTSKD